MKVILRRMESLGGLAVSADEPIEVDRVRIGRGTDQDVQLADMRVTLAHAEIRPQGGAWRLECRSENPVWVNGSPMADGPVTFDDALNFGRFRVHLRTPPPGSDAELMIEIEEHMTARAVEAARKARVRVSLTDGGLRKRGWAWGLAIGVLLVLLALPAALRYGSGGEAGASLDRAWVAGPASAAHSGFIHGCDTCHQAPFVAVRNEACLACHRNQAQHGDHPEILALDDMSDARCGSCHLEHTGRDALIARKTELCTDCHADPDDRFAAARLAPVSRFNTDHPGFTLSLPAWENGQVRRIEVAQDAGPAREQSRLKFPHDAHLVREGVASPEGKRVLACADCHKPMGTSFTPIRMEDHCQSCHQLDFDPEVEGRRLPHRAPGEVAAIILDHYARMALVGGVQEPAAPEAVRLLRRPGEALRTEERQAAMGWAQARAEQTMDDVFSRRVCVVCHEVVRTDVASRPYDVEKVALTATFFTGARFDHSAHKTESCERCHDANQSKLSTDVLVPPLANCRECHGDPGTRNRLGTACIDCHGFHMATGVFYGTPAAAEKK
ncbi:MAG: FHA domain-containing protein [Gammaproteobacteria bacterium]